MVSVPCGAVSGDGSQTRPLLYGRLSFSAENSLPSLPKRLQKPSPDTAGHFGSNRERKGGKKRGFPAPPTPSLSPFLPPDLSGVRGGGDDARPGPSSPGGPGPPLSPPARCELAAEQGARSRRSLSFLSEGSSGQPHAAAAPPPPTRLMGTEQPPVPAPFAAPAPLQKDLDFSPAESFSLCASCPSQTHKWIAGALHCHIYSTAKLPSRRILQTEGQRSQALELRRRRE